MRKEIDELKLAELDKKPMPTLKQETTPIAKGKPDSFQRSNVKMNEDETED